MHLIYKIIEYVKKKNRANGEETQEKTEREAKKSGTKYISAVNICFY